MKKKVGIYDPYLDTLGGGERYCLTVAEILSKNGFDVDLFWSGDQNLLTKAQERFDLKLNDIKIVPDIFQLAPQKLELIEDQKELNKIISTKQKQSNPFNKISLFFKKIKITQQYDLFFYLSDGSIPFLFSKKNFLHFQVPLLESISFKEKIINEIKFRFISDIIVNSKFTQKVVEKNFNKSTNILYPPVDINKFSSSSKKENIIVSVGRFDNVLNAKKQDILIDAFSKVVKNNPDKNWKLVLAGGSLEDPNKNSYLNYLKTKAQNLPIEFMVNISFDDLKNLYSKSKIYWHAAGFGVNENINPEKTEHFGMTVVEAMSSGLVPVIINKGGLPETIQNNFNGFLWDSLDELAAKTQLLINSSEMTEEMSKKSVELSQKFSKENFEKQFLSLINL